jgi:hypothetical protein
MKWIITGLSIVLLLGCSTAKKEPKLTQSPSVDKAYQKNTGRFTRRTLAGKCRIRATIKEIDTTLVTENPDDICAKFPCNATITIDEVLGYGAGFNKRLAPGEEIIVRFQFTLAPSEKAIPGLQLDLPGLKNGMQFLADLEEAHIVSNDADRYTIYRYEIDKFTGDK